MPVAAFCRTAFLEQQPVAGTCLAQLVAQCALGPQVGGGDEICGALERYLELLDFPDSGAVELDGRAITRWTPARRGRGGLARTFQHSRSFRNLSVRENVEVSALGGGVSARDARRRAEELLALLGLERYAHMPASALAHGDERKLGVARALATEPRYVLLDEPAAGLPEPEVPDFACRHSGRRRCTRRSSTR